MRILVGLTRVGAAIRAHAWEASKALGLNPTQSQILATILRAGSHGLGLSDLADELGVSLPTVSDSVAALERKSLVAKKAHPGDRRRLSVTLTRKGRSAAQTVSASSPELLTAIDMLTEAEQADLLHALVTVVGTLATNGQIAPARTCATCRFFAPDAHPGEALPHHCNFADVPFGDLNLRFDCLDHEPA